MRKLLLGMGVLLSSLVLISCGNNTSSNKYDSDKTIDSKINKAADEAISGSSSDSSDESTPSSSSSSSESSDESSTDSSSVSDDKSKEELKTTISTPMNKENYSNIENGVLEAANYDDEKDPNNSGARKRFDSRTENLKRISNDAENKVSKEKKWLTSSDYSSLVDYTKKLSNYLDSLYNYAVTFQADNPSINNPNTSSDLASSLQAEIDSAKSDYLNKKASWSTAFDAIEND